MTKSNTIEDTLHCSTAVSTKMSDAIDLWLKMYKEEAPWLTEGTYIDPTRVVSLGLPSFIASEKARMATIEFKSEITTPVKLELTENPNYQPPTIDEFGNTQVSSEPKLISKEVVVGDTTRAEFLNNAYKKLKDNIRRQLEYGIAGGSLVIKPYLYFPHGYGNNLDVTSHTPTSSQTDAHLDTSVTEGHEVHTINATMEFDYIHADGFYPLAFNGSGELTEAAFLQIKTDKNVTYTRLEHHKLEGTTVTVTNKAFKSTNTRNADNGIDTADLGQEIPLTDVPEWADLQPEVKIGDVNRLLFAVFKMPEANTVDPHSPLGVSGYSRAISLIEEADKQYSRLLWEFEGGELAIDVDRNGLIEEEDDKGRVINQMPKLQQRLFRKIDLGDDDTYQVFNPQYRDSSLINGLNNILMRIEDVTSLSRGTLSDVASEARTATELKILKQRSFASNLEIQKALEKTLRDVIYVMDVYCTLYNVTAPGQYDVSFEWDDSILVDVEAELGKRLTLMQNGLAGKLETRMWYFGETESQARQALEQVRQEELQNMENDMYGESSFQINSNNFKTSVTDIRERQQAQANQQKRDAKKDQSKNKDNKDNKDNK